MTDAQDFRPLSAREVPRFAGVSTFLRLPVHDEPADLDVMICGVPFDGGTTFRPGARFGPRAVRVASALGRGFQPSFNAGEGLDIFEHLRCADGGDVLCIPMDTPRTLEALRVRTLDIARTGAVPLFVGGDHTLSLAVLEALAELHGPVGLVHFDAHSDTFGPAWDIDLHHGTVFRLAQERGLLRAGDVLQLGIRGPWSTGNDLDFAQKHGFEVIDIDAVKQNFAAVVARLERLRGGGPYYVSFDMDALDPAYAPGTGTPVPGGMTTYEALRCLRALSGLQLVGGDVVEISPDHDPTGNTALVAVGVLSHLLGLVAVGGPRAAAVMRER